MPSGENIAADVEAVKRAADQSNGRRDHAKDVAHDWGNDLVETLHNNDGRDPRDALRASAKAAGLNPDEVEREVNRRNGALLTLMTDYPPPALAEALGAVIDALGVPLDEHLAETPTRAAKMWLELLSGYREDPAAHLEKTFEAPRDPGLVIQAGIPVQSVCAHHMLPFVGTATVAYRPSPGQRIVGLSKLSRVVQGYAARFQVQERICAQVVDALIDKLNPSGAICLITASHDCMRLRGVRDSSSMTTTQARDGLLLPEEISLIHQQHAAGS